MQSIRNILDFSGAMLYFHPLKVLMPWLPTPVPWWLNSRIAISKGMSTKPAIPIRDPLFKVYLPPESIIKAIVPISQPITTQSLQLQTDLFVITYLAAIETLKAALLIIKQAAAHGAIAHLHKETCLWLQVASSRHLPYSMAWLTTGSQPTETEIAIGEIKIVPESDDCFLCLFELKDFRNLYIR